MKNKYIEGIFISRENRFITKVNVNDVEVIAHLPNTGRCKELLIKGVKVILEEKDNSNRKTKYTLHYVENKGVYVNLISVTANEAAYNSLKKNMIPEISNPEEIKKEVKYGNSRIDLFCLSNGKKTFIEVKGVTLIKDGFLQFPDAPTTRGAKHLEELIKIKKSGHRAVILFVAQHLLGNTFKINREADSAFYETFYKAIDSGVEAYVYNTKDSIGIYELDKKIKMIKD